jgi:Ni/Fe-hydrogenase 1 B-type cytochrome subunit
MATETAQLPPARGATGREEVRPQVSYYVYKLPLRLWHWITALLVGVLALTGYFIASPPQSVEGDTSVLFNLGRLREWHFIAAWFLIIGLLGRIYWAIVGGKHARQIFYLPVWKKAWWKELLETVKWYAFIGKEARWLEHNPLARASMFVMFVLGSLFQALSGLALYGEQLGENSWVSKTFGWMISLAGSSMTLRTWHHVGMWVLVLFVVLHIYAAVRDDIMGRVSTISSMVSGWRTFRDFQDGNHDQDKGAK